MEFLKKYAWIYLLVLAASIFLSVAASETVTLVSGILEEPAPVPLTVVIDPGHGGEDGGAVSVTGISVSGTVGSGTVSDAVALFVSCETGLHPSSYAEQAERNMTAATARERPCS